MTKSYIYTQNRADMYDKRHILFSNINKICKNQNKSNPFYIKKSASETFCFNNEVNLPNSEVYLPNSKVDLPNSEINLPNK